MDPVSRNAPHVTGKPDGQPIVFAHGFGCDSNMWRFIAPRYEHDFQVVTFDHVGITTLVLQCRNDVIAPIAVGEYVRDNMPNATYRLLEATGHCPNLSAPDATAAAIDEFIEVTR